MTNELTVRDTAVTLADAGLDGISELELYLYHNARRPSQAIAQGVTVAMLAVLARVPLGVSVVGPAGCGKSSCIDLAGVLLAQHGRYLNVYPMLPRTLPTDVPYVLDGAAAQKTLIAAHRDVLPGLNLVEPQRPPPGVLRLLGMRASGLMSAPVRLEPAAAARLLEFDRHLRYLDIPRPNSSGMAATVAGLYAAGLPAIERKHMDRAISLLIDVPSDEKEIAIVEFQAVWIRELGDQKITVAQIVKHTELRAMLIRMGVDPESRQDVGMLLQRMFWLRVVGRDQRHSALWQAQQG